MKFGSNFAFNRIQSQIYDYEESATREGVGIKTIVLLTTALVTALVFINFIIRMETIPVFLYIIAGISTFVLQLIMAFSPTSAKKLSIPYAISEGLVIGCLCGLLELALPNMGLQLAGIALLITLSIFVGAAFLYYKGYIEVNHKFRSFLYTILVGSLVFSLGFGILALVTYFTNGTNLYYFFYNSWIGIALSAFMCVMAAMYVVYSFDIAEGVIAAGANKDMEWYASYAITLNVIYLFIEVLRLVLIVASKVRKD